MIFSQLLLSFLLSSPAVEAANHSYTTAFADSCLSRGHGNGSSPYTDTKPLSFAYEDGFMKQTLLRVYAATADPKYLAYVQAGMDVLLLDDGTIGGGYNMSEFQLDSIQEGPALLLLYDLTGNAKYKTAADQLVAQLDAQPTTSEGGYWHKASYPSQMWLDGLFMAEPFRAAYIAAFGPTALQTVAGVGLQFALVQKHMPSSGRGTPAGTDTQSSAGELFVYHAYDASREQGWANDVTGASAKVWGRGLGWYAMAVVDALDYLPPNSTESLHLIQITRGLAAGIAAVQNSNLARDPARLWYQLVLEPANPLNYIEASASAMLVYFLLKASRLGYVEARYSSLAQEAYMDFVDKFIVQYPNGTLDLEGTVTVGAPSTGYFEKPVRTNDMKGEAPFILASLEMDLLG